MHHLTEKGYLFISFKNKEDQHNFKNYKGDSLNLVKPQGG